MIERYKDDKIIVNVNVPDEVIDDMGEVTIIPFYCEDVKSYQTAAADLDPYVGRFKSTIESLLERAKADKEEPMDFIKRSINYIMTETFGDKGEVGDCLGFETAYAEMAGDEYPVCAYVTKDLSMPKTFVGVSVHDDEHYIEFMFGYLNTPKLTIKDTRPLFTRVISSLKAKLVGASKIAKDGTYVYDIITAPLDMIDGIEEYVPMWLSTLIKHLIIVGDLDKDDPGIGGFSIDDINRKE